MTQCTPQDERAVVRMTGQKVIEVKVEDLCGPGSIREHHPDHGEDREEFIDGLAAFARPALLGRPTVRVTAIRRRP